MSTWETLEPVIQQQHIRLRTYRVIRQPVDRSIVCAFDGLTACYGVWTRPTDTHLYDLCNDARDREPHKQPCGRYQRHPNQCHAGLTKNGIMDVPSALVYRSPDENDKAERDSKRDDEQQRGRHMFRFEWPLDRNIRQREFTLVSPDLVEQLEEGPAADGLAIVCRTGEGPTRGRRRGTSRLRSLGGRV
jgi:hypothetical protein